MLRPAPPDHARTLTITRHNNLILRAPLTTPPQPGPARCDVAGISDSPGERLLTGIAGSGIAENDGRRLPAALPVGWLASVWACGLAVVGGHLVIGVEQPGWPRARVLALSSPGAAPSSLDVVAAGQGPGGLPRWEIAGTAGR
jgi:hypothetical protein